MTTFCSTTEAAERSGATFRQLDYFTRCGYVRPTTRAMAGERPQGKPNARRWSPADVAAAATIAAIISGDPPNRSTALAVLAAQGVYAWHGRAPFAVVVLPGFIEPAFSAEQVVAIFDDLRDVGCPAATVVSLEDGSDG